MADLADGLARLVHGPHQGQALGKAAQLVRSPAAGHQEPVVVGGPHLREAEIGHRRHSVLALVRHSSGFADQVHCDPLLLQAQGGIPQLQVLEILVNQVDDPAALQVHAAV
ncbi:MAG: hypothetical protein A2064_10530 [Spirochaetes bacterium GWB1_66_5]|nr:MAG: hypothetical protein A2064_10530 [Spirochaetes bacterium GWB1_66_5]